MISLYPYDNLMQQMNQPFIRAFIQWNLIDEIEFLTSDQQCEDYTSLYLAGGPL